MADNRMTSEKKGLGIVAPGQPANQGDCFAGWFICALKETKGRSNIDAARYSRTASLGPTKPGRYRSRF